MKLPVTLLLIWFIDQGQDYTIINMALNQKRSHKNSFGTVKRVLSIKLCLKLSVLKCTWCCRCWVLLDANYNVYLYEEGVLRTASESYQSENLDDVTSHLTNHCLQKELSANFGMYEEGNEMFFSSFDR